VIGVVAVFVTLTGVAAGYAATVPLPDEPSEPQASVLYYRDGKTVLARLGVMNRTDVTFADIPESMRTAVLVAEDRAFYDHSGLSLRGVTRAAFANLKGDAQGASTITQQYARNAYLTQERTASRKAREMVLALKIEGKYSKNEILCKYLNTIYFGRGAYGIAAAAQAYFGVTPNQLSLAQSALLAAVIRSPWGFDPAVDEKASKARWQWVIDSMRQAGHLSAATASGTKFPAALPATASLESLDGPNGHIADAVERELEANGVSPQLLHTAGLRVVTTIDQQAQRAALERMKAVSTAGPNLRGALVAVDPATGGIRAYYGGSQGQGFFDDAIAPRPPASTFKPVALAAGLKEGVSYLSEWDGSSPRTFPGRVLYNQKDLQCPYCTLDQAMVQSLNTPFYALTEKIGVTKVRDLALKMGVSASYDDVPSLVDVEGDPLPGKTRADISLGRYAVSPADLASVYATFAARGTRTDRHIVELVTVGGRSASAASKSGNDQTSEVWYSAPSSGERVMEPTVAADVTTVLHHVAEASGQPEGHEAAAKTGTQQWGNTSDNQDAWMAGYTPSLATVVWVGSATPGPIRDATGKPIAGEGLPAQLWRDFMTDALRETQPIGLPGPAHLGLVQAGDAQERAAARAEAAKVAAQARLMSSKTRSGGKTLALTFDDGPWPGTTDQILDVLAQYGIKATFCMVGDQVADNAQAVKRVGSAGHQLCNHTMNHELPANTIEIKKDLNDARMTMVNTAPGSRVDYFRAPGGDWGVSAETSASLGMTPLTWTVDTEDWTRPGADAIVQAVKEQLRPGGIVLMHDGGGDRSQTVTALKTLIPTLLREGWTFDLPALTVTPVTVNPDPTPSSPNTPSSPDGPSPSLSASPGKPSTPSDPGGPTKGGSPSPNRTKKTVDR
jgi:membrane peptidoglycan carboxypeptidase